MQRIDPRPGLAGIPCIITAVGSAKKQEEHIIGLPVMSGDGYTRLDNGNRFIRQNLSVRKAIEYRKGQRPLLKDLHLNEKAIVCVKGHYLYLDNETYYSFFENENDEVVKVWILK